MPWAGYGGMENAGSGTTTRQPPGHWNCLKGCCGRASEKNRAALHHLAEATAKHAETGAEEDADALEKAKAEALAAKAYLTHAKNSRNAVRIKSMLELSKASLVIKADKLDANPFDLNTPAGIVDLTTGRLQPHDRAAYCSQITQTGPDTKGAEMWSSFLDTITCGDGSIRGFLQLVAGMALHWTALPGGDHTCLRWRAKRQEHLF